MKNLVLLIIICLICAIAIFTGSGNVNKKTPNKQSSVLTPIPEIGKIQILNGCGAEGAANRVADYLRLNNFDVKFVGNADAWNYPYTMVISRNEDTTIANQIASVLKTDKLVKILNNDNSYDVTVFIGPDFEERIQ
jgi:hypothetical protein